MINHARTLLANLPPFNGFGNYLAEEFTDPDFKVSVKLPTYIENVRRVLFGAHPDRHMVNYRTRQLLTLTHATHLEEYLLAFDSRVTYSLGEDTSLFSDSNYLPTVSQLVPNHEVPAPYIYGNPNAPDQTGKLFSSYQVKVLSPSSVSVTTFSQILVFDLEEVDGIYSSFPLGDTGYLVRLTSALTNYEWLIEILRQPQWDLSQLALSLETIGEPTLVSLFGVANVEPYLTFKNLWYTHQELALRLSGLLLALIYRTEEIRNAGS